MEGITNVRLDSGRIEGCDVSGIWGGGGGEEGRGKGGGEGGGELFIAIAIINYQ